jgi:hypothetical protein
MQANGSTRSAEGTSVLRLEVTAIPPGHSSAGGKRNLTSRNCGYVPRRSVDAHKLINKSKLSNIYFKFNEHINNHFHTVEVN